MVLCEGFAEMDFVLKVLAPHLSPGTTCSPSLLGKKVKHGKASARGGVIKYEPVRRQIFDALGSERSTTVVTTMIDLYRFPTDFPNYRTISAERSSMVRVNKLESAMHDQFHRTPRFIPYVQLHEFESLVFADLEVLRLRYEDAPSLMGLQRLINDTHGLPPESINLTPSGAPSKRLLKHVPRYDKRIDGITAISEIGVDRLRDVCPHFGQWLTKLENLTG